MYRKRDWTQDWDGASGRPKAVSPLELENEIETAPGIDPGAAEQSLPGAAAEARAPSPTPPSPPAGPTFLGRCVVSNDP